MQPSRRAVQTLSPRVAALLAALIALAASALGAGAAHAAAWLPGPTLTQSAFAPPQTAIGADGGAAVLSTEIDMFGSPIPTVVLRRLGPDGAQLGPLSVGKGFGIDVVALPGGGYRAAWAAPGPPTNQLIIATVDATGRVAEHRPVARLEPLDSVPVGAIAADGSAFVAWKGQQAAPADPAPLRVLHVAANGASAPTADLGPIEDPASVQLVRANDGSARLLWERPLAPNRREHMVGRVSTTGVGASAVLDDEVMYGSPRLAVGGGDPVVLWADPDDPASTADLLVGRLPSSGPVAGAATTVISGLPQFTAYADVAVATDGTATLVWSRLDTQTNSTTLVSRQLAPSGALGPAREISQPAGFVELDVFPRLKAGRDGTFVLQWFRGFPAIDAHLQGFSKVLDSTGAAVSPELSVPYTVTLGLAFAPRLIDLSVAPSGNGLLAGATPLAAGGSAVHTARFDGAPPALEVTVPAAAVRGTAASFAARASDPSSGIARITWQFGDGASADGPDVTHVYDAAGPRTVTATATDAAGESASVTREITVSEPAPAPDPAPRPDPAPAARRTPARLRVTKAARRGARVTVTGTIDRRARGRVTVTWAQRSGRRTVRRTVRVRIVRGRFAATIRLPRALARARVAGRLTVTYGGDGALQRATVARTVRAAARRAVRGRR